MSSNKSLNYALHIYRTLNLPVVAGDWEFATKLADSKMLDISIVQRLLYELFDEFYTDYSEIICIRVPSNFILKFQIDSWDIHAYFNQRFIAVIWLSNEGCNLEYNGQVRIFDTVVEAYNFLVHDFFLDASKIVYDESLRQKSDQKIFELINKTAILILEKLLPNTGVI